MAPLFPHSVTWLCPHFPLHPHIFWVSPSLLPSSLALCSELQMLSGLLCLWSWADWASLITWQPTGFKGTPSLCVYQLHKHSDTLFKTLVHVVTWLFLCSFLAMQRSTVHPQVHSGNYFGFSAKCKCIVDNFLSWAPWINFLSRAASHTSSLTKSVKLIKGTIQLFSKWCSVY